MRNTKIFFISVLLFAIISLGVAGALAEPSTAPLNIPAPQVTEDPNPPPAPGPPTGPGPVTTTTTPTTTTITTTSSGRSPVLADLGSDGIVYTDRGNIIIYGIDSSSRGYVALVVTAAEIAAVSSTPEKNTLILRDGLFAVYRLTTGELQVNIGPVASGEVFEIVFENTGTNKARVTSFGGSS